MRAKSPTFSLRGLLTGLFDQLRDEPSNRSSWSTQPRRVMRVSPQGGAPALTSFETDGAILSMEVSPDSSRIAYRSVDGEQNANCRIRAHVGGLDLEEQILDQPSGGKRESDVRMPIFASAANHRWHASHRDHEASCVDEKSVIQALDRMDRRLPLSPGRAERHGFEYFRHGTPSLF